MTRILPLSLASLVLAGCSLTRPAEPPAPQPELEGAAPEAGEAYAELMRCTEAFAIAQAPGSATASEIAAAVPSACFRELERLRVANHMDVLRRPLGPYQTAYMREKAVEKVMEAAQADAHALALRIVIETRSTDSATAAR